ncbi:MAG: ABC transporter permease [Gemmatimonas sp.]
MELAHCALSHSLADVGASETPRGRFWVARAAVSRTGDQQWSPVAFVTLALGIGATTALFGVVKAVLLTPLPYGDPQSLAVVWSAWKGFDQTWLFYDEYEAYETEISAFENAAIFSDGSVNLTEGDQPERVRIGRVQEDVFRILGVRPLLGREFTKEEDRPNGPNVIILGHDLWNRRYNADSAIIGKEIQVNGAASLVVGVMPEGFKLPLDFGGDGPTLAWFPLATDAASNGATTGPAFTPGGGNQGSMDSYGSSPVQPPSRPTRG